tara:strand:+ start:4041 stop:5324 length:1284 start_codon:yes stop_codon:yes gene_type:complete
VERWNGFFLLFIMITGMYLGCAGTTPCEKDADCPQGELCHQTICMPKPDASIQEDHQHAEHPSEKNTDGEKGEPDEEPEDVDASFELVIPDPVQERPPKKPDTGEKMSVSEPKPEPLREPVVEKGEPTRLPDETKSKEPASEMSSWPGESIKEKPKQEPVFEEPVQPDAGVETASEPVTDIIPDQPSSPDVATEKKAEPVLPEPEPVLPEPEPVYPEPEPVYPEPEPVYPEPEPVYPEPEPVLPEPEPIPEPKPEPKPTVAFGQPCTSDSDCRYICKDPGGLGTKICTKKCQLNMDCASDQMCEVHSGSYGACVPRCQKHSDCKPYKTMLWCSYEGHCWLSWKNFGAQCYDDAECKSGLCADPGGLGFKICTKQCSSTNNCGSGQYCKSGGFLSYCVGACSAVSDCAKFDFIYNQCINKTYCWWKLN